MLTRRGAHFAAHSKVWRWALLIAGLSLGALGGAALATGGDAPRRVNARDIATTTPATSTTALQSATSSTVASRAVATKSGASAGSAPGATHAPSTRASAPATTAKPTKATPTTKPSPTTSWWYDYCKPYCSPDGTRPENPRR